MSLCGMPFVCTRVPVSCCLGPRVADISPVLCCAEKPRLAVASARYLTSGQHVQPKPTDTGSTIWHCPHSSRCVCRCQIRLRRVVLCPWPRPSEQWSLGLGRSACERPWTGRSWRCRALATLCALPTRRAERTCSRRERVRDRWTALRTLERQEEVGASEAGGGGGASGCEQVSMHVCVCVCVCV
jgi:hypothetical protein